ncbi:hypothetical protein KP509_06G032700 [Ceratopteris richardii]|uniref:Uncharacterized protein n=1 Tax=Ceratopteris richardii TaxID=49495 RepID=A0A8T2UJN0_CERRI|nr:hypothetical protein KP509_06G032700 [Ceratopteris richardii]
MPAAAVVIGLFTPCAELYLIDSGNLFAKVMFDHCFPKQAKVDSIEAFMDCFLKQAKRDSTEAFKDCFLKQAKPDSTEAFKEKSVCTMAATVLEPHVRLNLRVYPFLWQKRVPDRAAGIWPGRDSGSSDCRYMAGATRHCACRAYAW